ncbi:MAG: hypothetical protein FJW37_08050 [Acidobacteria bacterium]|nr:hypothetical protein [Acidobacteriota bacterium]
MRAEALLIGFLLALARVAGVLTFLPLPGIRSGPEPARVVLALSFTLALFSSWPLAPDDLSAGRLAGWMLAEAALGIAIGLAASFLAEAFVMAAQIIGLQAGYAYASTIDPSTQADSGILLVFVQLIAGLLFLALGLDREIIRILAQSFDTQPPGGFLITPRAAESLLRLGASLFSVAFRLALPVVALLVLVDLGLALLGRLNQHLQLLTLAFPVKMLAAILLLAWIAVMFPAVYRGSARGALEAARVVISGR